MGIEAMSLEEARRAARDALTFAAACREDAIEARRSHLETLNVLAIDLARLKLAAPPSWYGFAGGLLVGLTLTAVWHH